MKFCKELYPKAALIKAAYNFTDEAYVHLDADNEYYYVSFISKEPDCEFDERLFINEMLAQSVRHEVYLQTRNIRELLLARAMATSVVADESVFDCQDEEGTFVEEEILRDWFAENENAG